MPEDKLYDCSGMARRKCNKCQLILPIGEFPSKECSSEKNPVCKECKTRSTEEPSHKVEVPKIIYNERFD